MCVLLGLLSPLLAATPAEAAGLLKNASWSASSTITGATGVTYSYGFLTPNVNNNVSAIKFTVPADTGAVGTQPTLVSASARRSGGSLITLASPSITLSGTTLTFSFTAVSFEANSTVSIQVGGLINTTTAGSYPSTITTMNGASTVDSASAPAFALTAASLTGTYWTASSTKTAASPVTYSYQFTAATTASLLSVTISVPPGTTGSSLSAVVTPAAISGGTATLPLGTTTLTYLLSTAQEVTAGTTVTIAISGLKNTTTAGSYTQQIVTMNGVTPVDAASTPTLTFTTTSLTALSWSASNTAAGAAGSAYTYGFTATTALNLYTVRISVPPGTTGTPQVGVVSAWAGYTVVLASPTATLSGTTLTFNFTRVSVPASTVFSIEITGLINTSTAGSYAAAITTFSDQSGSVGPVDSGTTPSVSFTSSSLTGLSWSTTSTATDDTDVGYTYTFKLPATALISKVTISVPPGTGGNPQIGTATPASIARNGVLTFDAGASLITYTFDPASIDSTSTLTIPITGFTNTTTSSVYSASIVAYNGTTQVASATTPSVSFTSTVLTALSWTTSSTTTEDTAVTYTYGFTTSAAGLSSVTMTVPDGTAGTPQIGALHITDSKRGTAGENVVPTNQAISLSGTTLTFSFDHDYFLEGAIFVIPVTGLTNSPTAGTYSASVTTREAGSPVASGTTPSISLSSISLGNPTWTVTSTALAATSSYTYSFVISNTSSLGAFTMSLPAGTTATGPLTVSAVAPAEIVTGGGASIDTANNRLTYSFPSRVLPVGTTVTITINGLKNTTTAGTFTSTITVLDASRSAILASAITTSITFASTVLTNMSWTSSSLTAGATNVTYTYGFTTASTADSVTSVAMTVPNGTPMIPPLSLQVTATATGTTLVSPTILWLDSTTLVVRFTAIHIPAGTTFSIEVVGMTNTPVPGSYSSSIATRKSGVNVDSGTTPALALVGGFLTAQSWTTNKTTAGADNASYTYAFKPSSTSSLSAITMTVPAGTTGSPTASTFTGVPASTSVSLTGNTLTYTILTPQSITAGTAISITISGLTNTKAPGNYTSLISTWDGTTKVDSGTAAAVTITTQSLAFSNACAAPTASCAVDADGSTHITLIAIPGMSTPAIATVDLGIKTNASNGYRVQAQMSPLARTGGGNALSQALTTGSATPPLDQFYASMTLSSSGTPGAVLCAPNGPATPYAGYPAAPARSIWMATGSTGTGTDHVTVTNAFQPSITQAAGVYTATISYTINPMYAGVPAC